MVNYLQQVNAAWEQTKSVAISGGATEMQLDAIDDLQESEFGYGSNCRLKDMWRPYMDKDGDLVLMFEKLTPTGYEPIVSIAIDGNGIMTCTRHDCSDVEVYDPMVHAYVDGEGKRNPMWVIAERFLEPLKRPSIAYAHMPMSPFYNPFTAAIVETGEILHPVMMWDEVEHVFRTAYWDGPLEGFGRHCGQLIFYFVRYEDDVSRERIFTTVKVNGWNAAKMHMQRVIWKLELRLNKTSRRWMKKGWIRFPRFNLDYKGGNFYGYLSTEKFSKVTG